MHSAAHISRTYSLVSLGLIAIVSGLLFAGTSYFDPSRTFRHTVASLSPLDYLANLRRRTEFGCRSFVEKRPDILFVGDSHTYSAIRFDMIGQALDMNISACALGGFYLESFPLLFDAMKAGGYYPKAIVLGASPREFVEGRDKWQAVATHKVYLSSNYTVRDFVQEVFTARLDQSAIEADQSHAQDESVTALHEKRLAQLDSAKATSYMARYPNKSFNAWKEWAGYATYTSDVDQKIADVCHVIQRHHIALYVIDIPESPFLRQNVYSEAIRRGYREMLSKFWACSENIIEQPASYYGIDDRYFFNREMRPDFDYETIAEGKKIGPGVSGEDIDYNLDHMNTVGATLFTMKMIPMLRPLIAKIKR